MVVAVRCSEFTDFFDEVIFAVPDEGKAPYSALFYRAHSRAHHLTAS
jgi:hypothetical protein